MLQVQGGDVTKLGVLFERHHVKLYNFLLRLTNRRELSEDIVQDVFLRILRYGHSFRGDAPFTVWMYRLARNAAADQFRKWGREMPTDEEPADQPSDDPLPSDAVEGNESIGLLRAALARLTADKREVLVLSRYQGLKLEEIGDVLGCPVGTVKAKVHRALKDLKKEYDAISGQ
jgi:RNA polymerase sigma-70 factor (ECF subfamily)